MDKETLDVAIFEEIDKARRLLGLQEFASVDGIKKAYRQKAFQYHPDKSGNVNAQGGETMKSLNRSYKLLLEYCSRYKYSFKEEDIGRAYPDDAYVKKWVHGWFEGI